MPFVVLVFLEEVYIRIGIFMRCVLTAMKLNYMYTLSTESVNEDSVCSYNPLVISAI